ncbi:MAG TPA: YbaB/EbfC family nucleoid-associated protein [Anaerolineales bacterium]|nr:YbaB/EbfC family nucleoid-associated protein [Anaerolineales bacterium]
MANFGNLPKGMAQQLQALQQQLANAQKELAEAEVEGTAGGGVVKITIRGDQTCTNVQIAPEILEDNDPAMLQDLVMTAFNNAQEALQEMTSERLGPFSKMLGQ